MASDKRRVPLASSLHALLRTASERLNVSMLDLSKQVLQSALANPSAWESQALPSDTDDRTTIALDAEQKIRFKKLCYELDMTFADGLDRAFAHAAASWLQLDS